MTLAKLTSSPGKIALIEIFSVRQNLWFVAPTAIIWDFHLKIEG